MLVSSSSQLTTFVSDEPSEIQRLRELIINCVKLATHIRPDLDALLSIWECQRVRWAAGLDPVEVLFIPANTSGIESGILAVDIGSGSGIIPFGEGFSIKKSELGGSAAMAIFRLLPPDDQDAFASLTYAVSRADETGENVHSMSLKLSGHWKRLSLRNQVLTSNDWATHRAATNVLDDHRLLEWWSVKWDGMVRGGARHRAAKIAAPMIEYVGDLAILPMDAPKTISSFAYNRGAKVVLFSAELGGDRWALGLVCNRSPLTGEPYNLNVLRQLLEENFHGIFVHPSGFMAGWTAKGPLLCTRKEFLRIRDLFIQMVCTKFEVGE